MSRAGHATIDGEVRFASRVFFLRRAKGPPFALVPRDPIAGPKAGVGAGAGASAHASTASSFQDAEYVLYWCQASVRSFNNLALDYAVQRANGLRLPCIAVFGVTDSFPGANERSFAFLFEGLLDAALGFARRGVRLIVLHTSSPLAALQLAKSSACALLVVDKAYLRVCREWRRHVAAELSIDMVEVEDNVIVPTSCITSPHGGEKAAATLRPKLLAHLDRFLRVYPAIALEHHSAVSPAEAATMPTAAALAVASGDAGSGAVGGASAVAGCSCPPWRHHIYGPCPAAAAVAGGSGTSGSHSRHDHDHHHAAAAVFDLLQTSVFAAAEADAAATLGAASSNTAAASAGAVSAPAVPLSCVAASAAEGRYVRLLGRVARDARFRDAVLERLLAALPHIDRSVPRIRGIGAHGGLTAARSRLAQWVAGGGTVPQHHAASAAAAAGAGAAAEAGAGAGVCAGAAAGTVSSGTRVPAAPHATGSLAGYASQRKGPEEDKTSRLSPYLHFGHISAVEVAVAAMRGLAAAWPDAEPSSVHAGAVPRADRATAASAAGAGNGSTSPMAEPMLMSVQSRSTSRGDSAAAASSSSSAAAQDSHSESAAAAAASPRNHERDDGETDVGGGMMSDDDDDNDDDNEEERDLAMGSLDHATAADTSEVGSTGSDAVEIVDADSHDAAATGTLTGAVGGSSLPAARSAPAPHAAGPVASRASAVASRAVVHAEAASSCKAPSQADRRSFLNELLVWRELAVNFVQHHIANYDDYSVISDISAWAAVTLEVHAGDRMAGAGSTTAGAGSSLSATGTAGSSAAADLSTRSSSSSSAALRDAASAAAPPLTSTAAPTATAVDVAARRAALIRAPGAYTFEQLECGGTGDAAWNAAQREMLLTGRMHGYMRMYWGKMLLAWASSPQSAHAQCVYLNDKWELDGRTANGYLGIAWVFGAFDRPFPARPIFGQVRPMTPQGLHKFNIRAYIARVDRLHRECDCPRAKALVAAGMASAAALPIGYGVLAAAPAGGHGGAGAGAPQRSLLSFFSAAPPGSSAGSAAAGSTTAAEASKIAASNGAATELMSASKAKAAGAPKRGLDGWLSSAAASAPSRSASAASGAPPIAAAASQRSETGVRPKAAAATGILALLGAKPVASGLRAPDSKRARVGEPAVEAEDDCHDGPA